MVTTYRSKAARLAAAMIPPAPPSAAMLDDARAGIHIRAALAPHLPRLFACDAAEPIPGRLDELVARLRARERASG